MKVPRAENRLEPRDAYLFHHYISHVAPVLTPVHTCQNPWLRYPAIALHQSFTEGRKHLLHAMMALTAMWLSEASGDREDLSAMGTKLYSTAMAELRSSIDDRSVDYLGLLTTILTFLFIEVSYEDLCAEICPKHLLTSLQAGPRNFKDMAVPSIGRMEVPAATSCFQYLGQL